MRRLVLLLLMAVTSACSLFTPEVPVPPFSIDDVRAPGLELSDEEVHSAVAIAVGDDRFAHFLNEHSFRVAGVRAPEGDYPVAQPVVVEIELTPPTPDTTPWPAEGHCNVDYDGDQITGVVWLISLQGGRVDAVSPKWGNAACGY